MKAAEEQHDVPSKRPPGSLAELHHNWRYFFRMLALILLIVLFYAEENWRGEHAWKNYQRESAARGDLLQRSAYVPPGVPDDQNFALEPAVSPLFWGQNFAPRFDAAAGSLKTKKGGYTNSWVKAKTDLLAWHAAFLAPTNRSGQNEAVLTVTNVSLQTAVTTVLAAMSESDKAVANLRLASQRPRSRFNLNYDQKNPASILLPHLARLKHISVVLQVRASAELAAAQTATAGDEIKLMLYLVNASREEPILVSHLVRAAQLNLALQPLAEGMNQWSDAQLEAFENQLASFDFCADALRTLEAERVLFGGGVIDCFRRAPDKIQLASNFGNQTSGAEVVGALMSIAPNGWFYFEQVNYCRTFADSFFPVVNVEAHRVNPSACRRGEAQVTKSLAHSPVMLFLRHKFFCSLLMPALSRAVWRLSFAQAAAEEASVACALQRYRLAHGDYPDSLHVLVPQFIGKLPHDLIDGKALKYQRTANGKYLLYSVGWNERDDGGRIALSKIGDSVDLEDGDWLWQPLE